MHQLKFVATASDPYEARDKIIEFKPDVMTLDVEMPRMNGIEFLKRLMPQYPIPVVVVSAVSHNVFDALNAGAVDFVTKPDLSTQRGFDFLINELIIKIKIASMAKVGHWKKEYADLKTIGSMNREASSKIIAIGASTGGTEAIYNLLRAFPRDIPVLLLFSTCPRYLPECMRKG